MLKTDDDTFVRVDRVLHELIISDGANNPSSESSCLYWGNVIQLAFSLTMLPKNHKWHIPTEMFPHHLEQPLLYMQVRILRCSIPLICQHHI